MEFYLEAPHGDYFKTLSRVSEWILYLEVLYGGFNLRQYLVLLSGECVWNVQCNSISDIFVGCIKAYMRSQVHPSYNSYM
jgi:hypothetical protein